MEFIRVSEMLATMELKGEDGLPILFKLRAIELNLKAGTGGKRIEFKDVVLVGGSTSNSTQRDPSHFKNFTRNVRSIHSNETRKIHPLLVEEFNGLRVVL